MTTSNPYDGGIRTGISCDTNSSTDTSVPAEVFQVVAPGDPPSPPPPPLPLPPAPFPPGDPPDEPPPEPPPGGYPPPPGGSDPVPTPPDDPVDPCEPVCTQFSIIGDIGETPTCPAGTTQVGIVTAHFPDGDASTVICEDCEPPQDPDCFPPLPETCPGNSFTFTIIADLQGYSFLGGCNGYTGLAGELVGTFTVTKYLLNTNDINWLVLPASADCDGSHAGLPNQYILRQGTGPYYNTIWSSGTVDGFSSDYWVGGPPAWYAVCTNP